jgi:hypothetical protein
MATSIKGSCLCGSVRYECKAEPIMQGHCQCRDCQKETGTGHASFLVFPMAAVQISGPTKEYRSKADSGNTVSRCFCPNCGSQVYGGTSGFPDGVAITAATLDDPSLFKPQMVAYTIRGHAWDQMDAALPKFERMPPMQ